jgi:hypothetical protein
MVFNERVMGYTVSALHNDVVDYRRVLRLTTARVSGSPSPTFRRPTGSSSPMPPTPNVFLPAADFEAIYRVLREESLVSSPR